MRVLLVKVTWASDELLDSPIPHSDMQVPCDSDYSDDTGDNDCCSGQCDEGQGDCDVDYDCRGSLTCGNKNCAWNDIDDCCESSDASENAVRP